MIDNSKKYRTRGGLEVRIYANDCGGDNPIHGAIKDYEGWASLCWKKNGSFYSSGISEYDLIEVKLRHKREIWINVYEHVEYVHKSKILADTAHKVSGLRNRLGCIKVELDFEEGEGNS